MLLPSFYLFIWEFVSFSYFPFLFFFIICVSLSLAHSLLLCLSVFPVSMSLVTYYYFFPLFCVQFCLCSVLLSARNQVNCVPKLKSNTTLKYYFKIYTYMYVYGWYTHIRAYMKNVHTRIEFGEIFVYMSLFLILFYSFSLFSVGYVLPLSFALYLNFLPSIRFDHSHILFRSFVCSLARLLARSLCVRVYALL